MQWCSSEGFDRTTCDIDDRPVFDYRSTVASALSYLAQRSGLSSYSHWGSSSPNRGSDPLDGVDIVPHIQSTYNLKAPIIIALVSNYDIEGVKRLGSIKNRIYAFGRLLLREGLLLDAEYDPSSPSHSSAESPKWYLDYKEWQWVPVPKEGLGPYKNSSTVPIDVRFKVKVPLKSKPSNSALRSAYRALETSSK